MTEVWLGSGISMATKASSLTGGVAIPEATLGVSVCKFSCDTASGLATEQETTGRFQTVLALRSLARGLFFLQLEGIEVDMWPILRDLPHTETEESLLLDKPRQAIFMRTPPLVAWNPVSKAWSWLGGQAWQPWLERLVSDGPQAVSSNTGEHWTHESFSSDIAGALAETFLV